MGAEGTLQISTVSVVDDVLQHRRSRSIDIVLRKDEEASESRYEATAWLRKIVGVVGAKDLPAEPSEEDFRLGLRTGVILCNVLNKIQPGSVPKVVPITSDSDGIPDGAALSTCQFFENVKNFLAALGELGLPTFEVSDLEKGGNLARIVNSVLALKSYSEWKQGGGLGAWKFGGNLKHSLSGNSHSRSSSYSEMSLDGSSAEQFLGDILLELDEMGDSHSLHMLVRDLISDKKQEEIPIIVQNMLSKVKAEFEQRLANQIEQIKVTMKATDASSTNRTLPRPASGEIKVKTPTKIMDVSYTYESHPQPSSEGIKVKTPTKIMDVSDTNESLPQPSSEKIKDVVIIKTEDKVDLKMVQEACCSRKHIDDKEVQAQVLKQKILVKQQHRDVQALKVTLSTAKEDVELLKMKYQEEVKNLGKHLHGLAHAASGYQKVLEENRKLYNQVQDLKGSIRVYCRVRPFLPGDPNRPTTVDHLDERSITIATPSKNGKDAKKSFTFNRVFGPAATQGEVFLDTQPLIRSVLDGYNVCIFAYGQTGAGKTYTMSGPDELTEETMGVNYRALNDLFHISEQRKNLLAYDISVQMTEIYNEQIRDLLATDGANKKLEIRNSSQKGINVPNANLVPVATTNDVINLMNLGQKNRAVSATAMNGRSSRSHSCLTIHVQGREMTSGSILRGCMHLVDLAGSERVDKSEVVGDRLKEAQHINKSLAALGDVISSLAQKNAHVPYRNSKLTQLLQDSLGGQAKTLMFVHISPEHEDVGETISTLNFAQRVSTVELGAARSNKDSCDVKELKEQIASLKAALARKEGESGHQSKSVSSSYHSLGNTPSKEELGNVEVRSNSGSRRKSFDPQDISTNSPPSPLGISPRGLRVSGSDPSLRDWVDKNMVNKQDNSSSEDSPLGRCIEDKRRLTDLSSQDCEANNQRSRSGEAATTANADESDEQEATASDGSDPDSLPQVSAPKPTTTATTTPNVAASKLKKPSPRQSKIPELRSLAPPARKLATGVPSPLHKNGKQTLVDAKRKVGRVK